MLSLIRKHFTSDPLSGTMEKELPGVLFGVIDVTGDEELMDEVYAIREQVFCQELLIPATHDRDGHDSTSQHFLALLEGVPVACGRTRRHSCKSAQLERIAVLPEYRDRGIGTALVSHMLKYARELRLHTITIQTPHHVKPFFETLGFAATGAIFYASNLLHQEMALDMRA